jgi:hypothetical protein
MVREEGIATFLNHENVAKAEGFLKSVRYKLSIWVWLIYQIALTISVN